MLTVGLQQPWKAALDLRGTTRLTTTYSVAAPTFTPNETVPASIIVTNATGAPELAVTLRRFGRDQFAVYTGTLRTVGPRGTLNVQLYGTWNPTTLTFTGAYTQSPRQAGQVRLTLQRP